MKLRVAPLYNKMWRQGSSLQSRVIFIGELQGVHEHWARFAPDPRLRRVTTVALGMGYLSGYPELASPRLVSGCIQPRGEP